jgi:polyribonucleotide nucleotidyltransferase
MAKAMIKQCIMDKNQGIGTKDRMRSEFHSIKTEDAAAIETVEMVLPGEKVRALIGPYGTRIKKIRNESMAKIHIQGYEGSEEQIVSVTGSKANIEKAEEMIKMFTA